MNPIVYAGLPSLPKRIVSCSKRYFKIESFEGRKSNVIACKRVAIILLRNMTELTQEKIFPLVGLTDHAAISYTLKTYAQDYYGGNEYCEFVYLNIMAMTQSKPYYRFNDIAKIALERFPIDKHEKNRCLMYLDQPDRLKMTRNLGIRAFVVYLKRKSTPTFEIAKTIGIPGSGISLTKIEIENEKVFTGIISEEIQKIIKQLKNQ
jgi:hypothetical protein